MFFDFLSDCNCVISYEQNAFRNILQDISERETTIGFIPAILWDLYPLYALQCLSIQGVISPNIYIMPISAANCWAHPHFEQIITDFYENDEYPDSYNTELEEVILLNSPVIDQSLKLNEEIQYNMALCSFTMPNSALVYVCIIPETPHDCWKKVIEHYVIPCDIMIDSHRGLGNFFYDVPLYNAMKKSISSRLRPHYYFKGLYNKTRLPKGFDLIYTIPEKIMYQNQNVEIEAFQKEIYIVNWDIL